MAAKSEVVDAYISLRDIVFEASRSSDYTNSRRNDWRISSMLIGIAAEKFLFSSSSNDSPAYDVPLLLARQADTAHQAATPADQQSIANSLAANRAATHALERVTP